MLLSPIWNEFIALPKWGKVSRSFQNNIDIFVMSEVDLCKLLNAITDIGFISEDESEFSEITYLNHIAERFVILHSVSATPLHTADILSCIPNSSSVVRKVKLTDAVVS